MAFDAVAARKAKHTGSLRMSTEMAWAPAQTCLRLVMSRTLGPRPAPPAAGEGGAASRPASEVLMGQRGGRSGGSRGSSGRGGSGGQGGGSKGSGGRGKGGGGGKGGPNYPSTTGRPSGGGRGNTPKGK